MKNIFVNRGMVNFARRVYELLMRLENKDSRKKVTTSCDPQWPICHFQLHKNKIEQKDPEPWVFK